MQLSNSDEGNNPLFINAVLAVTVNIIYKKNAQSLSFLVYVICLVCTYFEHKNWYFLLANQTLKTSLLKLICVDLWKKVLYHYKV